MNLPALADHSIDSEVSVMTIQLTWASNDTTHSLLHIASLKFTKKYCLIKFLDIGYWEDSLCIYCNKALGEHSFGRGTLATPSLMNIYDCHGCVPCVTFWPKLIIVWISSTWNLLFQVNHLLRTYKWILRVCQKTKHVRFFDVLWICAQKNISVPWSLWFSDLQIQD